MAREAVALAAALMGLVLDVQELNAEDEVHALVTILEGLKLAEFASVQPAVRLEDVKTASNEIDGELLRLLSEAESSITGVMKLESEQVRGQLQQVLVRVTQAQEAVRSADYARAQQALQQVEEPIQIAMGQMGHNTLFEVATGDPLSGISVSDVLGAEVVNMEGETVAEFVDLVKRKGSDDLYGVMEVGAFLGSSDKEIVLPAKELNVSQDGQFILTDMTRAQLERMPVFEEDQFEAATESGIITE